MPGDMIQSERHNKLFRLIARQTLCSDDAVWLEENIQKGIDWPFVAQRALKEGLASFFYYHCRNLDVLAVLPEDIRKIFGRIYAETLLINRHLLKVMDGLGKALKERKLQVIVLKGAALLNTVYHDVALRPMEDIDLMVRQEHRDELKNLLETMGFVQSPLYPDSFRKGILSLDIHSDFLSSHRILSRREVLNIRSEDVWNSAIPVSGSTSLYGLSLYDNLIALSFHLLKHRYSRLIWFVDIAEMIHPCESAFTWLEMIAYSRRVHADRILLYALLLTKHLIGVHVPDDVLMDLGKENLSQIEKYLLRLRLMQAPLGTMTDMLWIFQLRGAGRQMRFVAENIFPQRNVMKQIFPSSPRHFTMLLQRSALVFSQVLSDLFMSIRCALKTSLPPL